MDHFSNAAVARDFEYLLRFGSEPVHQLHHVAY
jgi:hypothetical protein